ncbi:MULTISPECIES: hypothetical protein [Bacillus cereus group]|uniref:hypothetical protein n=1 Tax=Bacillus cereus group TaxID=86661 RepID=UPI000BEC6044|nr:MULTISPECIES: hypothetical protein [Bacillus cereus group]MBJ7950222.1 hypothetical protein [Bacillus cereus group sp. N24]PEB26794.1 hypothetical protein COO14_30030 [Bacillus toyonensis]
MFYKVLNMYSVINYDKNLYEQVQKNIDQSRGFVCCINSKKNTGKTNSRYEKYLRYKQALYTIHKPHTPTKQKDDFNYDYEALVPPDIDIKKINQLYKKFGVQEDYINEYKIINEEKDGSYVAIHTPTPIECLALENLIEIDKKIEQTNRFNLSKNFVMHNHKRYMLLPFLIKSEGKFTEAYVIANIYDIGIITLQITMTFEHKKVITTPDNIPKNIKIPEVHLYKSKENYKSDDFWEKDIVNNIDTDGIMEHYIKQLSKLSNITLEDDRLNRRINWVFGDFEKNKRSELQAFINNNKDLYASYLLNGTKEHSNRYFSSEVEAILKGSEVYKNKQCIYMCSPTFSILTFGSSLFFEKAKEILENHEKESVKQKAYENELRKQKAYDEQLNLLLKKQTIISMFDFLRFYELGFIKKYFVRNLLQGSSNNQYTSSKDYNLLRKEFNFLKLQYDEDILFCSDGSAKNLYKAILEKTETNALLKKSEELFKNIREDIVIQKEIKIKSNETNILIISSLLTIVLGYNGIRLIVNDILTKIHPINQYVILHPLRSTVLLWIVLISIMLYLNVKRWIINRQ